ncbi:unnamed protein product, partial [Ixodes persulcatus]
MADYEEMSKLVDGAYKNLLVTFSVVHERSLHKKGSHWKDAYHGI